MQNSLRNHPAYRYIVATMYGLMSILMILHGAWYIALPYFIFAVIWIITVLDFDSDTLFMQHKANLIPNAKIARFGSFCGMHGCICAYVLILAALDHTLPLNIGVIFFFTVFLGVPEWIRFRE